MPWMWKENPVELKTPGTVSGRLGKNSDHLCRRRSQFKDLEEISQLGRNRLNVTIGSALDLFGGPMSYEQVLTYISKCNAEKEKSI